MSEPHGPRCWICTHHESWHDADGGCRNACHCRRFSPCPEEPAGERIARLEREKSEALGKADALEILLAQANREREACGTHDLPADYKSAAEQALDDIAAMCGCPDWEYPGQVVRDVEAVTQAAEKLAEALGDVLAWIDEVGAEAKRRDTERLAPARAALSSWDAMKEKP